jgi:hypothetical protein
MTPGGPTTNVNVHINGTSVTPVTPITPVTPKPAPIYTPNNNNNNNPAYNPAYHTPDNTNPDSETNEAISSLNDDIDDEANSHTSLDPTALDSFPNRFYILLQIRHAQIPDHDLDEQTIKEIFTTTLAHHQERLPDHLLLFKLGSITFRDTARAQKANSRSPHSHFYQVILVPAATQDQFDPELFHDQCTMFALQKWHHHSNFQFNTQQALFTPAHISPPSSNPWAQHITLLLPACNGFSDPARGCLLGISPDFFGSSRRAITNILRILFDNLTPNLPATPLGKQLTDWYSFQEYIGLRPSTLQHGTKKAKTLFICCFNEEAWSLLLTTAKTTGPINVHGCLTKISEFPPPSRKQDIITRTIQQLKDLRDLHPVHTDRLRLSEPEDEQTLLFLTPNLVALSPRFVDHLPSPVCHTLFFQPDPTTLNYTSENLHKAHIPSQLLAPPPRAPYLRTSTTATTTTSPPRSKATTFDDSDLDDIFNQWSNSAHEGSASNPIDTDKPLVTTWTDSTKHQKRRRNTNHPQTRSLPYQPTDSPPTVTSEHTSSTLPSSASEQSTPPNLNYYENLTQEADDEHSATQQEQLQQDSKAPTNYLQQNSQLSGTDGSETDLNPPPGDAMSTDSSSDSTFSHTSIASSDHFSADGSDDDLSAIYSDQQRPPARLHPAIFDLMDFEAALSQQALLHYQQLDDHIRSRIPHRHDEFHELLAEAVRTNQDPADLETTINSWSPHHHP